MFLKLGPDEIEYDSKSWSQGISEPADGWMFKSVQQSDGLEELGTPKNIENVLRKQLYQFLFGKDFFQIAQNIWLCSFCVRFQLYLQSKLVNPHFRPEARSRVSQEHLFPQMFHSFLSYHLVRSQLCMNSDGSMTNPASDGSTS